MIKMDEATLAQVRAAAPTSSTWVSANAGSGKTRVLTNRVARLLLLGAEPQKILCLTYTKAAAAEMQNRLFDRLGSWSMKSDADLRTALEELGEKPDSLTTEKLSLARTLFASALETPGGLKIQTIHSFCERVLRRFPLEAGVSPQFTVLEDRQAKIMRAEILDEIADGPDGGIVQSLGRWYTGLNPDDLLIGVIRNGPALLKDVNAASFGINGAETPETLWTETLSNDDAADLKQIAEKALGTGTRNDTAAKKILAGLSTKGANTRLRILESAMLLGSGDLKGQPSINRAGMFPTKQFQEDHPEDTERLRDYMERVAQTRLVRLGLVAYQRAQTLHSFAKLFVENYQNQKSALAVLDFDDQINRTVRLLTTRDMAQWVLFKLDGGIDHILVDEAQDTSPAQWQVVKQLAAEFTSGEGARDTDRTVFVVGDQKQSIYSFQGADPDAFDEMRSYFKEQLKDIDAHLNEQDLLFSFRSASPVLELVDRVADAVESGLPKMVRHTSFFDKKAGCVDLWPFIEKAEKTENPPWYTPLDRAAPDDPRIVLAKQIATHIKQTLQSGLMLEIDGKTRPVRAGDFLILVQGRSVLFDAIIKALKAETLPVAGADRLRIADELAVKDVLSLLRFMALPEDDLSLAEALRSPLFNISEGRLFSLAHDRGKRSLWQALRADEDFSDVHSVLSQLLKRADFDRPYDLIEMILGRLNGRKNLLARLGQEAEDAIDELVNQAMNYEQIEAPTLTGFLEWFAAGQVEVKRQLDSDADLIRVMTVHGAKGLEAPIVILPDTAVRKGRGRYTSLIEGKDGFVHWRTGEDETEAEADAKTLRSDKEKAENARLLYVALTRAESWLIVCGAGERGKKDANCWYDHVANGLESLGVKPQNVDGQEIQRFENAAWIDRTYGPSWSASAFQDIEIPEWAAGQAEPMPRQPRPIAPSSLPGAKALIGADTRSDEDAMHLGSLLHKLLEILPHLKETERPAKGLELLADLDANMSDADALKMVQGACELIMTQTLAHVFAADTLSEVAVSASIPALGGKSIEGSIDRLVVTPKKVTIIDYKSNQIVPQKVEHIPEGILRQLSVYDDAIRQIYPDREIVTQILWTKTRQLMTIPHDIVKDCLSKLQHLDDNGGHEYFLKEPIA